MPIMECLKCPRDPSLSAIGIRIASIVVRLAFVNGVKPAFALIKKHYLLTLTLSILGLGVPNALAANSPSAI